MLGKSDKKVLLATMLLFGLVSVTGCGGSNVSSYLEQQGVQAEKIVNSYNSTVSEAKNVEVLVKEAIFGNNFSNEIQSYIGNNTDVDGLKGILETVTNDLKAKCIDSKVSLTYAEESIDYIPSDEEINELLISLKDSMDVYYLLDKNTGSVEQFFVIRVSNTIFKISINWLGGVIYDYSYEIR